MPVGLHFMSFAAKLHSDRGVARDEGLFAPLDFSHTLMITCFCLNIAVPVTIHLWNGPYQREREKFGEVSLPDLAPGPEAGDI